MINENFSSKEGRVEGGDSDGYMFRINFLCKTDQDSVDVLRAFPEKHGYRDVPLPVTEGLWWYYLQPILRKLNRIHWRIVNRKLWRWLELGGTKRCLNGLSTEIKKTTFFRLDLPNSQFFLISKSIWQLNFIS